MTSEDAKDALRRVYERYVLVSLKMDLLRDTMYGTTPYVTPVNVVACVDLIETLTNKTLGIESNIEAAARSEARVSACLNSLGLIEAQIH